MLCIYFPEGMVQFTVIGLNTDTRHASKQNIKNINSYFTFFTSAPRNDFHPESEHKAQEKPKWLHSFFNSVISILLSAPMDVFIFITERGRVTRTGLEGPFRHESGPRWTSGVRTAVGATSGRVLVQTPKKAGMFSKSLLTEPAAEPRVLQEDTAQNREKPLLFSGLSGRIQPGSKVLPNVTDETTTPFIRSKLL